MFEFPATNGDWDISALGSAAFKALLRSKRRDSEPAVGRAESATGQMIQLTRNENWSL